MVPLTDWIETPECLMSAIGWPSFFRGQQQCVEVSHVFIHNKRLRLFFFFLLLKQLSILEVEGEVRFHGQAEYTRRNWKWHPNFSFDNFKVILVLHLKICRRI